MEREVTQAELSRPCSFTYTLFLAKTTCETAACWGHRKRFDRKEVSQATPHLQLLEETAVKLWQLQAGKTGHIRKGQLDKS